MSDSAASEAAPAAADGGAGIPAKRVADVVLNGHDSTGRLVNAVYARNPPRYAVYRTRERVLVHFADDPALAEAQRQRTAPLNPLRGEINGLIDGWHHPTAPGSWNLFWSATSKRAKAERFDRRVADALTMAMQGDTTHPADLLERVKNDVIAERKAMARGKYLIVAALFAMFVWLFAGIASSGFALPRNGADPAPTPAAEAPAEGAVRRDRSLRAAGSSVWLATAGGSLGAFFSIAIALRGRTILTDLQTRENSTDAVLRVLIGAIAGAILICLFKADVVRILDVEPMDLVLDADSAAGVDAWLKVLIIGFIAGFSERLVPDLLAAAARQAESAEIEPAQASSAAAGAAGATAAAGAGSAAVEAAASTAGGAPVAAPAAAEENPSREAEAEDEDEDACVVDLELSADEVTSDAELPAACGGVRADDDEAEASPEPGSRG